LVSLVMLDHQKNPLMRTDVKRREIWEWSDHTPQGGAPPTFTTVHVLPSHMAQQDFRIRHKVDLPRDDFLVNPARKSFNAAFFLGPIGHFAGDVLELSAPAPHDPTDYYGVRGNSRSLNRFFQWAMNWTFRLRSPHRLLVATQNDVRVLENLCPPMPGYLCLAPRLLRWETPLFVLVS
jgi:hypothetical protein